MSGKTIDYVVHKDMHGDGRDWVRGDTRTMTEADAAPLVAVGALAKKGETPIERAAPVEHTFGTRPPEDSVYIAVTGETVMTPVHLTQAADVSDSRVEGRRSPARRG